MRGVASSPSPTPPARSPRAERTRQRILDAAGQCFAAHGFAKTTVEEIARATGVSKALVYHHFRGKEEILEAVVDRTLTEWSEVSGEPHFERAESVIEAIGTMVRQAIRYARGNPVLRALIESDPLVLTTFGQEPMRRSMEEFRESLVTALEAGVASGELRHDLDVQRATDVIRILHMGLIQQVFTPDGIDVSDDALIDTCFQVLRRGVARGPQR
jgi:AcrR family transcriptional regulator